MNGILLNNTQTSHIPTTLIQPVIPGTTVWVETPEEQSVRYYNELIIAIMKAMDIQYITYCTDNQYQLITIHGAGETLIHIVPSKTLTKHLLKQKDKWNSIKIGVYCIKQLIILPNDTYHHMTLNLIKEWIIMSWWEGEANKEKNKEDNRRAYNEANKGDNKEDEPEKENSR